MATIELNKAAKQAGADHPNVPIGAKFKSNHKYANGAILVLASFPFYKNEEGAATKTAALVLVNSGKVWSDKVYPCHGSWDVAPHVKWSDIAIEIKKYELEQLPEGTKLGVIA